MPNQKTLAGAGHFDEQGNACVDFHLRGVKHDPPGLPFEGIIDTGFTGFIQLPLQHAMSLGLPLEGTITSMLADGSTRADLTALSEATLLGETRVGVVTLSPNNPTILVGMDFLRGFQRALMLTRLGVALIDEEILEAAVNEATQPPKAP